LSRGERQPRRTGLTPFPTPRATEALFQRCFDMLFRCHFRHAVSFLFTLFIACLNGEFICLLRDIRHLFSSEAICFIFCPRRLLRCPPACSAHTLLIHHCLLCQPEQPRHFSFTPVDCFPQKAALQPTACSSLLAHLPLHLPAW